MINREQFDIYVKYYGDGDMFSRCRTHKEEKRMAGFDWGSFDQMIQDIYLVYSDKTATGFEEKVFSRLNEIVSENGLRDEIIEYAKRLNEIQQEYKDLLNKRL